MKMPGGPISARPLHIFFLVDCSSSMEGSKIASLNFAVREALPELKNVADENPQANVMMNVLQFSSDATWMTPEPVPLNTFVWTDLKANGLTSMGKAFSKLSERLDISIMPERSLPPLVVLLTDGEPSDRIDKALTALFDKPWGKKSVRIGIGIGDEANEEVLERFINNPEIQPLHAGNASALATYIRWASTAVVQAVSTPMSQSGHTSNVNVILPQPPPVSGPISVGDVF